MKVDFFYDIPMGSLERLVLLTSKCLDADKKIVKDHERNITLLNQKKIILEDESRREQLKK